MEQIKFPEHSYERWLELTVKPPYPCYECYVEQDHSFCTRRTAGSEPDPRNICNCEECTAAFLFDIALKHMTENEFGLFLCYVYGWMEKRMTNEDIEEFEKYMEKHK